jgi:hypothetical protein
MNPKPEDWDPERPLGTGQIDDVAARVAAELRKQLPSTRAEAVALYGPLEFTHIQMDETDGKHLKRLYFLTSLAKKPDLYFLCFEYGSNLYFQRYVDHAMVEQGAWRALEKRIPVPESFNRAPWLTEKGEVIIGDVTHPILDGEGPTEPIRVIPKGLSVNDFRSITDDWEKTNSRRSQLIKKRLARCITPDEDAELTRLQKLAGARRQLISPLPTTQEELKEAMVH